MLGAEADEYFFEREREKVGVEFFFLLPTTTATSSINQFSQTFFATCCLETSI